MRVVVLGASGGVGRWAVRAAVEQGHEVLAGARTIPKVPAGAEAAVVDVRNADAVRGAVAGADVVLWCVGVTPRSGPDVGRVGMPHLVSAVGASGVARIVTISGAGVALPGDSKGWGARVISAVTRRLARDLVLDKEGEHAVLAASDLAWTEVRAPRLSDRDPTGRWRLTERAPGLRAKAVPKADAAAALLQVAQSSDWLRQSPFLVSV